MARQDQLGKHATTVKTDKEFDVTTITYHATEIVIFDRTSEYIYVTLNSGGYRTATTKTRMNQASAQFNLGFTVRQEKGEWFVYIDGGKTPFTDKMVLAIPRYR